MAPGGAPTGQRAGCPALEPLFEEPCVKFWLRWTANSLTVFLALYLVDSVAGGRFRVTALWVAVVLAVILGLLNSVVRPLRRARTRPLAAAAGAIVTLLLNALILQVFVWLGLSLTVERFAWVLVVAAFVSVLTGTVSWLVGFSSKEKPREAGRRQVEKNSPREGDTKASRNRAQSRTGTS
jgi:putative membrane protein